MKQKIQEVLKRAIAAHREGKLQDAEQLYRSILQFMPTHPEANYNLGLIAVSRDKPAEALPLFKMALSKNPKVEQFWLSYIEAIIKTTKTTDKDHVSQLNYELAVAYSNFGNVLRELKRLNEAEKIYRSAVRVCPSLAEAHSNLGNALQELGKVEESEIFCRHAIRLEPRLVAAHNNLGNALYGLRRLEEAAESFKQAIALKPDFAEAYSNLGNTLKALGKLNDAESACSSAIAKKPNYARAHNGLGNVLRELGRTREAELSYENAIKLKPDFAQAYHNLGNILRDSQRYGEAEANYRKAIALDSRDTKAHYQLLTCLFMQEKEPAFYNQLDFLINENKVSAITGSLTCRSALKYGLEKPNLFCSNPLNYVLHSDLEAHYDFKNIFVKKIRHLLNESMIPFRNQALLINGQQTTGNLFEIEDENTAEIKHIIRLEIEKYRKRYGNSEDGLIRRFPTEYDLQGWLISMKTGGSLRPHIHTEGWLSGSVYINVPDKLRGDSGKLVVCIGEESDTTDSQCNPKKVIGVKTGSIALFPASLMHYTIPFVSEKERVVLAFDVIDKKKPNSDYLN